MDWIDGSWIVYDRYGGKVNTGSGDNTNMSNMEKDLYNKSNQYGTNLNELYDHDINYDELELPE